MKKILFIFSILIVSINAICQNPEYEQTTTSFSTYYNLIRTGLPGVQVQVKGMYSENDGGGGSFIWNSISTADTMTGIIKAVSGKTTGRWERIMTNPVSLKWFGAKGTGISSIKEDTVALRNAMKYFKTAGGGRLYIPTTPAFYAFAGIQLMIPDNLEIFGDGQGKSTIRNVAPTTQHVFPGSIFCLSTYGSGNTQNFFQTALSAYTYDVFDAALGDSMVILRNIANAAALFVGEVIVYGSNSYVKSVSVTRFYNQEHNEISKIHLDTIFFKYKLGVPLTTDAAGVHPKLINSNNNNQPATYFGTGIVLHSAKHISIHDLTIEQAQRDELADTAINQKLAGIWQPGGGFECNLYSLKIDAYNGIGGNNWTHTKINNIDLQEERHMFDAGYASYDLTVSNIKYQFKNSEVSDFTATNLLVNDGGHHIVFHDLDARGTRTSNNLMIISNSWDIQYYNFKIVFPFYQSDNIAINMGGDSMYAAHDIIMHDIDITVDSIGRYIRYSPADTIGLANNDRKIHMYNLIFRGNKINTTSNDGLTIENGNGVVLEDITIPNGNLTFNNNVNCTYNRIYAPNSTITFKNIKTNTWWNGLTIAANDSAALPGYMPSNINGFTRVYKGITPPRITTTERDAIAAPVTGTIIYNTTTSTLNVYNGAWVAVGGSTYSNTANSITSAASPAPTGDAKFNELYVTALSTIATFSAPSGTLVNGNALIMRIKDDGTARGLNWNAVYRGSSDLPLPTTTIVSKTLYLKFLYNSADSKWDLIAFINNF